MERAIRIQHLLPLYRQGWQPVEEPGPGCIILTWENTRESLTHLLTGMSTLAYRALPKEQRARAWRTTGLFRISLLSLLSLLTLGWAAVGLLIAFLLSGFCAPERFQIRLRRKNAEPPH